MAYHQSLCEIALHMPIPNRCLQSFVPWKRAEIRLHCPERPALTLTTEPTAFVHKEQSFSWNNQVLHTLFDHWSVGVLVNWTLSRGHGVNLPSLSQCWPQAGPHRWHYLWGSPSEISGWWVATLGWAAYSGEAAAGEGSALTMANESGLGVRSPLNLVFQGGSEWILCD